MPYYDLRCAACAYQFEVKIGMNDELPPCPECANGTVKVFKFVPTAHFKGSGFAANDLRDNVKRDKSGRLEDAMPGAS